MSKTTTPARQPLPVPPGGWPRDNYTGHFGYFRRDPATGVREPADEATRRAMEARGITSATGPIGEPAPTPAPTPAAAPAPSTDDPGTTAAG